MAKTVGLIFPAEPVKKGKSAEPAAERNKKSKSAAEAAEKTVAPDEGDDQSKE